MGSTTRAIIRAVTALGTERTLAGKYRLGRVLGEGGMGAVYAAEHLQLGTTVAVKILNEAAADHAPALERFRREARTAAAVKHENIVEVTDAGTDAGVPYLVMELLEGESLSAILRRERVLSLQRATQLCMQILSGLEAAHERGIIHRDLKPGNIVLVTDKNGHEIAKVLDFGISKFTDVDTTTALTAAGAIVGTPAYMAPEQLIEAPQLDNRVDLYATGVLLYRMVTGKLPFRGQTQRDLTQTILTGQPVPPDNLRADVPAPMTSIIMTAIAANRDSRYQHAAAFREALAELLPVLPHNARADLEQTVPDSPSQPCIANRPARHPAAAATRAAPRRRPLVWSLGIAVALLGFLAAMWWTTRGTSSDEHTTPSITHLAPTLRLGLVRYLPTPLVMQAHQPVADYLAQILERPVELRIAEGYPALAQQLANRNVDIVALSPYGYIRAAREFPSLALLATPTTAGGASYEGLIISRADANISQLSDFKGKLFCFVDESSTSGYLYPRAVFRRHGIDPDRDLRTRFNADHLGALRALYGRACEGAAIYANVLYSARDHGMIPSAFRIVASTDRIPYDAYCAAPHVSPTVASHIRSALLSLKAGTPQATRVFTGGERTGFVTARDKDYDPVRSIESYLEKP